MNKDSFWQTVAEEEQPEQGLRSPFALQQTGNILEYNQDN